MPAGLRYWPAKGASQAPERLSALRPLGFQGEGIGRLNLFPLLQQTQWHHIMTDQSVSIVR
jgi:hypothetical protein